jgi:hypothetical protein
VSICFETARQHIGQHVRIRMPATAGGLTVRWCVVRSVTITHLVADSYEDSAGFGAYIAGRHVKDGVPVTLAEITSIDPDPYATQAASPARLAWTR